MARQVRLTQEGFERLQEELAVERRRLEEADRDLDAVVGAADMRDDTALEQAKRIKAGILQRVDLLEDQLRRAMIISERNFEAVDLGALVTLQDTATDELLEIQVVSTVEGDILDGEIPKVSDESPMGSALMKRRVGDLASVSHGGVTTEYRIVSIS